MPAKFVLVIDQPGCKRNVHTPAVVGMPVTVITGGVISLDDASTIGATESDELVSPFSVTVKFAGESKFVKSSSAVVVAVPAPFPSDGVDETTYVAVCVMELPSYPFVFRIRSSDDELSAII